MIHRIFKRLSLLLICVLILNTTLVLAASQRAAVIEKVTGTVSIKKSGGEKKLKAIRGANLAEGDTLITGSNGTVILKMDDDKTISVGPNTIINVKDLKGTKGNETTTINQPKGISVTKIDNKLTGGSTYNQKTPTAIMGVKGTIFSVQAAGQKFLVSVVDGKVSVQSANNSQSTATLTPGQQLTGSDTSLGEVIPLNVAELDKFILSVYHENGDSLPPDIVKQISDYIEKHPGLLNLAETSGANTNQVINYSDNSATGGGGGGNSSGSSSEIISKPPTTEPIITIPDPGYPPITSMPYYPAIGFSEYISPSENTPAGLVNMLNYLGANAQYDGAENIKALPSENLKFYLGGLRLSFTKSYTLNPGTSFEIPNEIFEIPGDYMDFRINEALKGIQGKTNQLQVLSHSFLSGGNGSDASKEDFLWYWNHFSTPTSRNGLKMTTSVKVKSTDNNCSHFITINGTTASAIELKTNSTIEFSYQSSLINEIKFDDDEISSSTNYDDQNSPDAEALSLYDVIDFLRSHGLEVTTILSIENTSVYKRQFELELNTFVEYEYIDSNNYYYDLYYPKFARDNCFNVSVQAYGYTQVSLEDILEEVKYCLEDSRFSEIADFDPSSVQIDSTSNLLDWSYTKNDPTYPVKNRILYYYTRLD